jgi:hypothetical protein
MSSNLNRREFIRTTAGAAAGVAVGLPTGIALAKDGTHGVAVIVDPADTVASSAPARWAADEIVRELTERGLAAGVFASATEAPAGHLQIYSANASSPDASAALKASRVRCEDVPEALALCQNKDSIWACGHDARGLSYALLELADRAKNSSDPIAALAVAKPVTERPANRIRSLTRLFTSEPEDKPWFNDREMWPAYLSLLATQRFNRFNLALGIGYDFLRNVTDAYFLFAYPFLLDVPGYKVRVPQLPDAERDANLETLRFISRETVARGMEFQLGIWMHGYQWIDSPNPNYTIEGLTPETHGPYCRDAVRALLQAVPEISGVTFRIHGESGVEEGSYDFWKTVFEGVGTCGRKVEIDMHAKGMDQRMIDTALSAGQPVKISPKYWAEHLGMPYHQADIREQERPREGRQATGLMKLSSGSRSFFRYGYGDLFREDRQWGVLHRIWPGTQRLLIWGDPKTAAAHSRAFSFCGSDGVEIMEPLSFKGRRGSGIAGDRCAYADKSLSPRWDWQKYAYSLRVWGRHLYNPNTDPEVCQWAMYRDFSGAGDDLSAALANASRILPIVTTAHAPSAGNNTYWPEVYLNHSLIDATKSGPYSDSPTPRVFGTVSPLDPQLFYRMIDFADDLLKGERSGKYTPIEVAQWLEDYADGAKASLTQAKKRATPKEKPEYRRLVIDIAVAADLGRFFGAKFRAGVLYHVYEKSGDRDALSRSLGFYNLARDAWAAIVKRTAGVYLDDITVGETRVLRGSWAERLADIDTDIEAIETVQKKLEPAKPGQADDKIAEIIAAVSGRPRERFFDVHIHNARKEIFKPGESLALEFVSGGFSSAQLFYRHVNQAERWHSVPMTLRGLTWNATIPAEYTDTPYPLQYYFELKSGPERALLYPGFGRQLIDQPYFVARRG